MARRHLAPPIVVLLAPVLAAQTDLERGFADPPAAARPHTWWHWMNGNITREGITADLEAMQAVGLGGAQVFNVSEGIPKGPILFQSEEWRALLAHAAAEAERLGLELCLHNCAGWSSSGGPWIQPEQAMQTVVTSELQVTGPTHLSTGLPRPEARHGCYRDIAVLAFPTPKDALARIKDPRPKAGYEARYGLDPALDEFPAEAVVPRGRIVDLTDQLGAEDRFTWDVPAGAWTVLRLGSTPTGAVNAPSPDSGRGLECDKLSRAGMDAHWAGMMAPVLKALGPLAGRTLRNLLIDSYEVGHQNWTASFRAEFTRRRSYDPLLLLPAMTGRVVDSGEVTERFLWDLRRTVGDLFAENYYDYFAELCHRHGLLASIEPYDGPFECLQVGRGADIPMGEFWVGGGESSSCKLAASVAHLSGATLVGAESFTAEPRQGKWQEHPARLKAVGDLMFTTGINRYILHRYAHQPWRDPIPPGMTMGQWGTHYERTTTWWTQGAAWLRYLARCQFLLQQGKFVGDVLYCLGEASPNGAPLRPECKAAGFDYDSCGAAAVLDLSVVDGRLAHPRGMSWRVLVLPDSAFMTTRLLTKVRSLVEGGATVIGPRPDRSPSLSELGAGDATVRALAEEVWGDCDGQGVKEHAFGKGRVVWGRAVPEVLADLKVAPDCRVADTPRRKVAWIHRSCGEAEIWFVSNQEPRRAEVVCAFRVSGRQPELWRPDTGARETAAVFSERDGTTTVPLQLDAMGSVFVVFRKPAPARHLWTWTTPEAATARVPKIAIGAARYEAVDGAGGADVTAKVAALVAAGETTIPANNATFGDPTYMHVKRLRIEFSLDGKAVTRTAEENGEIELLESAAAQAPPDWTLAALGDGAYEFRGFAPGKHQITTGPAPHTSVDVELRQPLLPQAVAGPWTVRFAPGRGAPASITLPGLCSWTEHADAGVRWFSGTADYETRFDLADPADASSVFVLDLGQVAVIAEVTLNGKDLGTWWKPPFAADVTGLLQPAQNTLRVRVTNTWVNRLIGDEELPSDCAWNGITLKEWPEWLLSGAARPSKERVTFTTWHHWTRGAQPPPSGLLGPVTLRRGTRIVIPVFR